MSVSKKNKSSASFDADTELKAQQFDIDRRLTEHLMANAITATAPEIGIQRAEKPSFVAQWLAFLALVPLLVIAWAYSSLFDKENSR